MANRATEVIVVSKTNKHGVRVGDKQYNYSPKYTGGVLEVNKSYEAEVFTSESGAKYINKILREIEANLTRTENTGTTTVVNSGFTPEQKTEYFRNKDRSMQVGGLSHDAATLVSALVTVHGLNEDETLAVFDRVLKKIVEIRNGLE